MSDIKPSGNNDIIPSKSDEIVKADSSTGCLTKALALGGILISALFLLNLTAGIIEIPDNLPIIGNLDEVAATTFMLTCLSYLGINIIPRRPKK